MEQFYLIMKQSFWNRQIHHYPIISQSLQEKNKNSKEINVMGLDENFLCVSHLKRWSVLLNLTWSQGQTKETEYPGWVLAIAVLMICASVAPIFLVFLLRRFQCLKYDLDIHQGAIRRIDTTVSTREMITDVDVSWSNLGSFVLDAVVELIQCVLYCLFVCRELWIGYFVQFY